MNRYYLSPEEWEGGDGSTQSSVLTLRGDEAKHCVRVMRANVGEEILVFDGFGRSAKCRIQSLSRQALQCEVLEVYEDRPVPHPIVLCQAIPKGGNMEWIVQKSVELGVAQIQPLITEHTVARPESLRKKQAKWQRIALEACKQCGQNVLPQIAEPLKWDDWLMACRANQTYDTAFVAALDPRAQHLGKLLETSPIKGKVALLIGPEGDLSKREYQSAYDAGFQPISFGTIIMRVETAALYGMSILQHEISKRG